MINKTDKTYDSVSSFLSNSTTNSNRICFKQVNLQKSKLAMINLSVKAVDWSYNPLFLMLQEPWVSKSGKVGHLPRDVQLFAALNPRAAIVVMKELNVWAMESFTHRDQAACLWKTGIEELPVIIIVSVYCDILKSIESPELIALLEFCNKNNYPVIMCTDMNSHSSLWGCDQNKAQGDMWDKVLCKFHLSVVKVGKVPC